MYRTIININGSKWAGQQPDTIEKLLEFLAEQPLDRTFEAFGNFAKPHESVPGTTRFLGNFFQVSHVFNIESDDPAVTEPLTAAIRANQMRPDYLAQSTYEEVQATRQAEADERYQKRRDETSQQARATLTAMGAVR